MRRRSSSRAQVGGLHPSRAAMIMGRTQPEGGGSGPGDIDRTLHPCVGTLLGCLRQPVRVDVIVGTGPRGDAPRGSSYGDRRTSWSAAVSSLATGATCNHRRYACLGVGGARRGRGGGAPREHVNTTVGYDDEVRHALRPIGLPDLELLRSGRIDLPIQGQPAGYLLAVRRGDVANRGMVESRCPFGGYGGRRFDPAGA
jgi:hypothetical protein